MRGSDTPEYTPWGGWHKDKFAAQAERWSFFTLCVEDDYWAGLVNQVLELMVAHWIPFGGVAVVVKDSGHLYVQAMVRDQ